MLVSSGWGSPHPGWVAAPSPRYGARVLLGDDLLEWIILALGAALLVGNLLALVRPPQKLDEGALERPPLARTATFMAIGAIAAIWALASLLST